MPTPAPEAIELQPTSRMNRIKRLWSTRPAYEPVQGYLDNEQDQADQADHPTHSNQQDDYEPALPTGPPAKEAPFSLIEYCIFLLLGTSMLWAWNALLASAPYFQTRFSHPQPSPWILSHFQSAELAVSTLSNLGTMLLLSLPRFQTHASYPRRIIVSLLLSSACFTLLALSTLVSAPAGWYFGFLLPVVLLSSLATGLLQNGLFAFAAGSGRAEYMQAIMTGQGVAGVLPPLVKILGVVLVKKEERGKEGDGNGTGVVDGDADGTAGKRAAFWYFLAAVGVALSALGAFLYLLRRRGQQTSRSSRSENLHRKSADLHATNNEDESEPLVPASPNSPTLMQSLNPPPPKPSIPLSHLFHLLRPLSLSVLFSFSITMLYPPLTLTIPSLNPHALPTSIFIPLAFLAWNLGDLLGRLSTLLPSLDLTHRPWLIFGIAVLRVGFLPLYALSNRHGRGAVVHGGRGGWVGDGFYLLVIQGGFGWTNGYVGSEAMVGAGGMVGVEEREAAGGFMALCLVGGLAMGSLVSFAVGSFEGMV